MANVKKAAEAATKQEGAHLRSYEKWRVRFGIDGKMIKQNPLDIDEAGNAVARRIEPRMAEILNEQVGNSLEYYYEV